MRKHFIVLLAGLALGSGCSAMHPLRGVPAAYMPSEYKALSREGKATINLGLLQRTPSTQYRIEAGDVLAVYAPGLLGLVSTQPDVTSGDNPPINLPANAVDRPSLGFPVTVRGDHTIQIPQLPPLDVYGLTEQDVEDRLRNALRQEGLLNGEKPSRVVVSVMRPRTIRVLVCRQESATTPSATMAAGMIDIGRAGKGTMRTVDLRAGENDVAHALAQPGVDGLPGLDARNVIYVIPARNAHGRGSSPPRYESQPTPLSQQLRGRSGREPIVRGQSPSRSWGHSVPRGNHPIAYSQSEQFNLSGQEIAQGSYGPPLIEPIPGMRVVNPSARREASDGVGYGHSAPTSGAFSDPTQSHRAYVGPSGSRFNPLQATAQPQSFAQPAVATRPQSYSPIQNSPPVRQSPYMPVQYSPSQASPLPADDSPNMSSPVMNSPVTNSPVMNSPVMNAPVMNAPSMSSPVMASPFTPRYPTPAEPVLNNPIAMPQNSSSSSPVMGSPSMAAPDMNRYPTNSSPTMSHPIMSTPTAPTQLPTTSLEPQPVLSEPIGAGHTTPMNHAPVWRQTLSNFDPTIENSNVIKIPVRLAPGEDPGISEEDITLYDGDIIFIENRDTDVYFIGGLLGGGQYPLPRDRDLHVLEAVSLAQGRGTTQVGIQGLQSSGGVSALNRDVVPSASRLLILREVGCNRTMTIEVDLYKALRYPHENILVQPSDLLVLQYTPVEAFGAFIQRNVLEGALLGIAAGSLRTGSSGK